MSNPEMSFTLSLDNQKVFQFYDKHKNINFERINVMIVDLLENGNMEVSSSMQSEMYQEISCSVSKLQNEYKLSQDSLNNKLAEFRYGYMEDLKMILSNNNNEKIAPLIKDYLEHFQERKFGVTDNLTNQFESLKVSINQELNKLKTDNVINNMEQKQLQISLTKLLENMGNSSAKGRISENTVFNVLQELYPMAEIEHVGTEAGMGDILIKRNNKFNIMIENKDYARSVNQKEVDKFKRDAESLNCSAILLSQKHGIVEKENYQIEIINSNVYIYIHNVEYSAEKIKIAINIIDHFKKEMVITEKNINMDSLTLKAINEDYNQFIVNKLLQINTIETFHKKIHDIIHEMKLPSIDKYLSECGCTREIFKEWGCKFCIRTFPTEKGLKNHNRKCKEIN